jgi:RND superfamily putative drug exporter
LARIREEQQELGPSAGPQAALERSGSLFLGSGLITAGVFASLLGGSLVGLNQFGFGLTCGLLLDSLVIRPLLLPACLLLTSSDQAQADPIPSQSPVSPPKETLTATVPRLSEE